MSWLTEARKAVTALTGAAAEAVALGLLHGTAEQWVTGVLAVATAGLVYLVPNDQAPAAPPITPPSEKAP